MTRIDIFALAAATAMLAVAAGTPICVGLTTIGNVPQAPRLHRRAWLHDRAQRLFVKKLAKARADLKPGDTVPGAEWKVDRLLSGGAFAVVYRVIPLASTSPLLAGHKFAALKVTKANKQSTGGFSHLSQAHQEVDVMKALQKPSPFGGQQNPYVPKLYETINAPESVMVVMQYFDKGSLVNLMQHHPRGLPLKAARVMMRHLVLALYTMHASGYAHNDIKPDNIFLDTNPAVRAEKPPLRQRLNPLASWNPALEPNQFLPVIGDYNVAAQTLIDEGQAQPGNFGAPLYRAPEAYSGSGYKYYSPKRADIFSLGMIFQYLLTGESGFQRRHVLPQPSVNSRLYRTSPLAVDLTLRMLFPDPTQRPSAPQLLQHPFIAKPAGGEDEMSMLQKYLSISPIPQTGKAGVTAKWKWPTAGSTAPHRKPAGMAAKAKEIMRRIPGLGKIAKTKVAAAAT